MSAPRIIRLGRDWSDTHRDGDSRVRAASNLPLERSKDPTVLWHVAACVMGVALVALLIAL